MARTRVTMLRWAMALVLASGSAQVAVHGGQDRCSGPTHSVRVTAQQLSSTPPTYALLVTNRTTAPLRTVVIGRGSDDAEALPIIAAAFNIPASIRAPKGWTGEYVVGEENARLTYVWRAVAPPDEIAPGQSATGFLVTLPPVHPGTSKQLFNGVAITQVNFEQAPFLARLSDGRCVWGRAGTDLLRQ